jgi:hypothetical protein
VRTEDDLRAALTSLERHAPHPARVLPSEPVKTSRGLRSPKGFRWIAGVSAAALAGVVTAVTVPGGLTSSHIPNGDVASAPATAAAPVTLRAKLLAAFAAASGQIVYEHSTWTVSGSGTTAMDSWYYPWQARQGQVVRSRRLSLDANGTPFQDVEDIYRMPAPGSVPAGVPKAVRAKLKSPLLSGIVAVFGEIIDVEYGNRTWSDVKHQLLLDNDPGAPVELARQVGVQHWTEVGTTRLEGRRVIELTWQVAPGSRSYLWVDASTYLPLREVSSFREGKAGGWVTATVRDDYQLLPATQANLAKLTPPIPAGFRQTPDQVLPYTGSGGVG